MHGPLRLSYALLANYVPNAKLALVHMDLFCGFFFHHHAFFSLKSAFLCFFCQNVFFFLSLAEMSSKILHIHVQMVYFKIVCPDL